MRSISNCTLDTEEDSCIETVFNKDTNRERTSFTTVTSDIYDDSESSNNTIQPVFVLPPHHQQQQKEQQEYRTKKWSGSSSSSASVFNAGKIYKRELRRSMESHRFPTTPTFFEEDLKKATLLSKENLHPIQRKEENGTTSTLMVPTDTKSNGVKKRTVEFSTVTIHEHPRIAGDNPGGLSGPPLSIAWEAISSTCVDIDKYEQVRANSMTAGSRRHRSHRRKTEEMRLESSQRVQMLSQLGISSADIKAATRTADNIRNRRLHTKAYLYASQTHERVELLYRRLRHIVTLGLKKRKEREYLRRANAISSQ